MSTSDTLCGVILAAGRGSRMGQLPTRLPKAVLPVLGEPIVYHQLTTMASLGIRKAYIVVGHLGYEVVREIERLPNPGLQIDYIEQKEALGIAHCVGQLEPVVQDPFLLFLGDIYFEAPRIHEMVDAFRGDKVDGVLGAIVEEDEASIRKNYCIVADSDMTVRRVIEKPRHPLSHLKGVGVYLFTPSVFDAIRRTPRTAMRDEYEITDGIQIFIDDGYRVVASCCIERDLNVTTPEDLLNINLRLLASSGRTSAVAETASVGAGAVLDNAVVGRGATIGEAARLKDSVVFANAVVPAGAELERAIVTETSTYSS